jgi:hypothetical protein
MFYDGRATSDVFEKTNASVLECKEFAFSIALHLGK